jgi:hypothetical protein
VTEPLDRRLRAGDILVAFRRELRAQGKDLDDLRIE